MLSIEKLITIPSQFDKFALSSINIPVFLSNESTNKALILSDKNKPSIKINDIIAVNLVIENQSTTEINPAKITIYNDKNFSFIPGSVVNTISNDCYYPDVVDSATITLDNIPANKSIYITFFIKATLQCIKSSNFNNYLTLLPATPTKQQYFEETSSPILASISNAILKVNTDIQRGMITLSNFGNEPVKNMYYKYTVPQRISCNISKLTATLNGMPTQVNAIKKGSSLLFIINNLPEASNNKPSELKIFFRTENLNSIHGTSMSRV